MKSKVYYSVSNGGDGSAYPIFYEDELCAEIDQDFQSEVIGEGWGESCTGELEVESDSPVKFLHVTTRNEYIKELEEELDNYDKESDKKTILGYIEKLKGN